MCHLLLLPMVMCNFLGAASTRMSRHECSACRRRSRESAAPDRGQGLSTLKKLGCRHVRAVAGARFVSHKRLARRTARRFCTNRRQDRSPVLHDRDEPAMRRRSPHGDHYELRHSFNMKFGHLRLTSAAQLIYNPEPGVLVSRETGS